MSQVHLAPLSFALAGGVGLFGVDACSPLSAAGWAAGFLYLGASQVLLARGLRASGLACFGWANAATALRSSLVGLVTALVATSVTAPVAVPLLVALTALALVLDAADGALARRTHTVSALGARFDMEVDAFALLVLSAYVAQSLGGWVLTIGALRYAFVGAGLLLPWMRTPLPPRYWRKVVTAVAGIALLVAAAGVLPMWADLLAVLLALALLLESFGRDVLWLAAHRAPVLARAQTGALGRLEQAR